MKKNKQVEGKILAKNKKNENEICPGTAGKKDTIGCNNFYTQSEKSQNQTTENGEKRDNKKSARKRDFQKQIKLKERERQCKHRKNLQKICLSKKDSKSLKNKSVPWNRKRENEICTIVKTNKQVEEQILAKKKKNENEICPCTAAKKDITGCNNCYTKSEKSQNQTTEKGKKRDNKKSAWKRDIQKQIKLKERERQCKHRKNIQKICLPKKDKKSLPRNVAKIIKLQERTRQCERRKNLQKECVSNEGNNNNVKENINFTHNEETHVKSVKNYEKRQVLNIVKEKKRIKEQQRRNCNTLQINTNVKSRNFKKKLHVSMILQKQNLANTSKSYAMCNLRTKYKILQRVKIMRQKQISKGINNN